MKITRISAFVPAALVCFAVSTLIHAEDKAAAEKSTAAPPASPRMLAQTCAGCHGPNGKSQGSIPGLQGLPADYIVHAMKDFKSGERPSTIMQRHAKGYTDEEIQAIAKFYAEQT
jgi:cytochrome c553